MASKKPIKRGIVDVAVLVFIGLCIYVIWSMLDRQERYSQSQICAQNMKALSLGLLQYSQDWDSKLPPANRWADSISGSKYLAGANIGKTFHCPAAHGPYGYALNNGIGSASLSSLPAEYIVLLFETDSTRRNATGSLADVAKVRHDTLNCSFCDGHVHWVNSYVKSQLIWKP